MSSSVEQIKERLSITDVLSSYLKLEKSGSNFKAVCPFHNEKTPSFFVSPSRNSYYCFGCGAKGDIFSFVEQFEGLDFKGALGVLALRAGVEIEPYRSGEAKKDRSEKDRLYELMEHACRFYENELSKNKEAQEYIKSRGLTPESEKDFRIGFAPKDWRTLSNEMKKKNFTDAELVLAGLAKHPDDNPKGDIYDRFRDRIMFPISDTGGRVIAFSGRILHDADAVGGKYINSPETPIFKKGSTLYGLDKAKFEIRKRDQAILVEGQMDLVLSHQAGFTNTVASSGTALSDSLVADTERGLLSGLGQVNALSKNLIIAFDADKAGMKAAGRADKIGLSLGLNVKVAKLPVGFDPADTIRQKGATEWKKIIDGAQHIVLFYLSVLGDHELTEHTRMRAIRDKILPYVAVMPSAVERVHFIREIHLKTGIPEEALAEDLIKLMSNEEKSPPPKISSTEPSLASRGSRIEDRLLGIVFWQESIENTILNLDIIKKRLELILGKERFKELYETDLARKNERIFEVELVYQEPEHLEKDIEELLNNLEEESLTKALQGLLTRIGMEEGQGNSEKVMEILKESQEITKRLNTIKSSRHVN
ncbi:MAG: DNA primase [Candidatus Pacebacteria bacterium]|nr:DNA primase [Candidatus Paceibacterota bacterium]